jgi:hypothetical protein
MREPVKSSTKKQEEEGAGGGRAVNGSSGLRQLIPTPAKPNKKTCTLRVSLLTHARKEDPLFDCSQVEK